MSIITRILTQAQIDTINAIVDTGSGSIITVAERDELGFITVTGAVDLDALASDSHTHSNLAVLDAITSAGSGSIISTVERDKLGYLTVTGSINLDQLALDSHTHANKAILDLIEEAFTTDLKDKLDGIEDNASADQVAVEVPYDNGNSGLSAVNVKEAIDEIDQFTNDLESSISDLEDDSHLELTLGGSPGDTTDDTLDLDVSNQSLTVNLATITTDGAMSSSDKSKLDGVESGAAADQNASEVPYSNTTSGLTATDAQAAIDEIEARVDTLDAASGEQNTASNLGAGEGVFAQKNGIDLEFKSVKSGDPLITVNSNATEVILDFDSTNLDLNTTSRHDALTLDTDLDTTAQSATLVGQELELKKATASTDGVMSSEDKTKLDAIEVGAAADQNADEIPVTPSGNLTSTNVQDALVELQTELDAQSDDQTATEVTYDNSTSGLTATNAQSAIDELDGRIDTNENDISNLQSASHNAVTLGGTAGDTTDDTLDLSGQELTVNLATTISDGAMSASDKTKLDGVTAGAEVNVQSDWDSVSGDNFILNKPTTITAQQSADITTNNAKVSNVTTNLSIGTITGTTVDIDSSDGTDATIPSATITEAGLMSAADKVILDGITDTDDQVASEVGVTPAGNLSSTDVQAALQELQGDIDGLSGATDELVKVTANDAVGGYLNDKIIGTTNKIIITEINDGADEDLKINIGVDVFDTTINDTDDITEGAVNKFASASAIEKLESIKSGEIAAGSFSGNPKIYDVVFATAYPDTQYIVTTNAITSNATDKYVTNVSNKTTTGFRISLGTGSISNLVAVEWYTIKIGE